MSQDLPRAVWHDLRRYLRERRNNSEAGYELHKRQTELAAWYVGQLNLMDDLSHHMRHLLARRRKATRRGK